MSTVLKQQSKEIDMTRYMSAAQLRTLLVAERRRLGRTIHRLEVKLGKRHRKAAKLHRIISDTRRTLFLHEERDDV